jgi:hypothetical protein
MGNSGGLVIPPSYFTLDEVTAAVSVMKVSRLNFDILLLGYQDNPISENAQNVVEVAAKDMIHKLKQTNFLLVRRRDIFEIHRAYNDSRKGFWTYHS